MRIIRASDCRITPWKNGGGSTTEIAIEPQVASLDQFNWRVSMARVESDGPFSEFSGVDRTLALVKGNGLALAIGDAAAVVLQRGSEPIRFAGDIPTSARLIAGQITDLNVMTRRKRFTHKLRRIQEPATCDFDDHDVAVVVACSGHVILTSARDVITLDESDAAIMGRASDDAVRIVPATSAECYLVLLRERRSQPG